ncbi:efflux RND transporter permease subunit [Thiomicrorhabdus sediminis]|uniref:RND family transporter n=1 Tax=Thiomicrorhabdus sediminis TaxID=2580412 RepID=A0A4P9K2R2_9GAMM|nr:MMPL family transporter [Thiomicrorhabdus sediminis]QCU89132.1 RND family transporter [Thiomicrorhabdus sediminis]
MPNSWIKTYADNLIHYRWWIIFLSIGISVLLAMGAKNLIFTTDYQVFFSEENPELKAFDALQNTYNKQDNILIALSPENGDIFTQDNLAAIEWLTKQAWQIPYSNRVDSITNFQYTYAEDDELIVEDLVYKAENLTPQQLQKIRQVALTEPQLKNFLINPQGSVTGINIINQFSQLSQQEIPESIEFTRNLVTEFKQKYPQFEVHLSGITMLNNAFTEASVHDMTNLIPIMYLFIFILLLWLLKSLTSLIGIVLVIGFSIAAAMGLAGWFHIGLTPPSASAPTIIMTLAVADSVHFLISMLALMKRGHSKHEAIAESLRINIGPIFLTSITTAIGFLAMNSSDAPPFHDMGNITAIGVMFALLFSITFLPAWVSVLPVRVARNLDPDHQDKMSKLAAWVIKKQRTLFWSSSLFLVFMIAMIPRIEINDNFVAYFDKSIDFRTDSDYVIENLTGINMLFYSIDSGQAQGINQPEYLHSLANFQQWLYQQPEVVHVQSLSDILKRLNKNLHGDDPTYYQIPQERELAAQYLLLYEMSLPYGLDLNNQINIDKSATKVTVTLTDLSTSEMLDFNQRSEQWLKDNIYRDNQDIAILGTSTGLMFSHITMRNIASMLEGSVVALVLISILLLFALRSIKLGVLSLVPNLTPAIAALGIWALTYGVLGMAASIVFAISIGIVVDDTVHFLSKYLRAKRENGLNTAEAISYAFSTVGQAIWVTTVVLVIGFALLSQSAFLVNQQVGILMAITISAALVLDFLFLPTLLLKFDKDDTNKPLTTALNETGKEL